jgi:hypothetical protein
VNSAQENRWHNAVVQVDAGRRTAAYAGGDVRLDRAGSQALLNKLDALEELFYNLLEYMEDTGEEDFVDRLNRLRDAARSQRIPLSDLIRLGRTVERVQHWPRELGQTMHSIHSAIVHERAEAMTHATH